MRKPVLRERVSRYLLRKLADGQWQEGARLPSLRSVATRLRVSIRPVYITWQWAEQIGLIVRNARGEAVAATGAADRSRQILAEGGEDARLKRLAILLPASFEIPLDPDRGPFHCKLVGAIQIAAANRGYESSVLNMPLHDQLAEADRLQHRFDAFVIVELSPASLVTVTRLVESRVPVVLFQRKVPGLSLPAVAIDDYDAGQRLAELFIHNGHTNMTLVTTSIRCNDIMDSRIMAHHGWLDALRKHHILDSCTMPVICEIDGEPFLDRLLHLRPRITAIAATSPSVIHRLAHDRAFSHIRVPHDLSIAMTSSSESLKLPPEFPPVTCFEVDWERAGACTMELIEHLMISRADLKTIRVPVRLHLTESIAPPAAERQA
jgi:DNA-binding LacI/PurR family transcriptional regulator